MFEVAHQIFSKHFNASCGYSRTLRRSCREKFVVIGRTLFSEGTGLIDSKFCTASNHVWPGVSKKNEHPVITNLSRRDLLKFRRYTQFTVKCYKKCWDATSHMSINITTTKYKHCRFNHFIYLIPKKITLNIGLQIRIPSYNFEAFLIFTKIKLWYFLRIVFFLIGHSIITSIILVNVTRSVGKKNLS